MSCRKHNARQKFMDKIAPTIRSTEMDKEQLIAANKAAVMQLLEQYAEYNRINGIIISGSEKENSPSTENKPHSSGLFTSLLLKKADTVRKMQLAPGYKKITPERRKELMAELEEISNAMKFANPAIWMWYKGVAYVGTAKHNPTVQAFVDHTRAEEICGKRIAYVNRYLQAKYHGDDLFSDTLLSLHMNTVDAANDDFMLGLCMDEEFMHGWKAGEFNLKGKWVQP